METMRKKYHSDPKYTDENYHRYGVGYVRASKRRSYIKNRDKILLYNHNRAINLRQQLMDILGGTKCSRCGFDDIRALQIDHINGGGNKDIVQKGRSLVFIRYYIDHPDEAKNNLQVLCANCNWIKRTERKEHRKNRKYYGQDIRIYAKDNSRQTDEMRDETFREVFENKSS